MQVSNGYTPSQSMPDTRKMPSYGGTGASHPQGIYAADSNKTNKYAIASIIAAVVGLFISMCGGLFALIAVVPSLILAYLGFVQIKKSRERGRELIIAAVVVNVVAIIIIASSTALMLILGSTGASSTNYPSY